MWRSLTLPRRVARSGTFMALGLLARLAMATNYYVSPTGNDAANGTSPATAWQTIARVNQSTYSIQPGDQILFQRGGVYRGEIIWGTSGTAVAPITYGAYGSGADPIISGSELVTGWTVHSGNIWKAQVGMLVDQVYIGGSRMRLARTPNAGWFRNDQASGNTMHSDELTESAGYWNGARVILRCTASSIDTLKVTAFSNGTITFNQNPTNPNMGTDDWGFYLDKRLDLLDAAGEWFYEPSSGFLYLFAPEAADPNGLTVEASVYWSGVNCYWQRQYAVIQGLHFKHQRNAGVRQDGASHVTVNGCTFSDLYYGIRSYGSYDTYTSNTFERTYASGCLLIDNNSTFENNTLTDIAMIPGEGEPSWGYFGIRGIGSGNIIRGNRFTNVGYTAIEIDDDHLVEKNVIKQHLATLNDGGGIAFDNTNGLIVRENIIYDPVCGLDGSSTIMPHYQRLGVGIYFGNTSNVNALIQRNTVANIPGTGINVDHNMNSAGLQIRDNVLFNNQIGLSISDYSNNNGPNAVYPYYVANYNDVYDGNVVYGLGKDQISIRFFNCYSAQPTDFGTFTNNRYFNPYNEMTIFVFSFQAGQHYWTLERWQQDRDEEDGSTRSPLHLNEWRTVSELSGNMIPGGNFTSNVSGWGGWPTNAQVTHNTTHLDNGCLKANLPDNSVYDSFSMRNPDWFDLENGANDWYRLDLSLESDAEGDLIAGIKGESQQSNPYTLYQRQLPFSPQRRDLSIYFQSPNAEAAQLMLVNRYTEPLYYLDNVQLHKVQVEAVDPLEDQIILINEQSTQQTFPLTGCWSDVNGAFHAGSVDVPAYRSLVLVREDDALCSLNTSVEDAASMDHTAGAYPNPVSAGGTINFPAPVNGRVQLIDGNGRVAFSRVMPPGSTSLTLPAQLTHGVYAIRVIGQGIEHIERMVIN